MTNDELSKLSKFLEDKSEEFRKGFFAAINSSSAMKAAFLRGMIGEEVMLVNASEMEHE